MCFRALWVALSLLVPVAARAEPELPYSPWTGTHFEAPRTLADEPRAEPRSARDWERWNVELGLASGFSTTCPLAAAHSTCPDRESALEVKPSLLWRVTPGFSWGPAPTLSRPAGSGAKPELVFMGIAGRVYFSDTARLDPWLELGLGLARDLRYVDGPAFASTLSAGVDLFATRRLRVGPWLAIRSSLARRNYCDAVDPAFCRSHSGVRYGLEGLAAGLSVTALLGSPL